MVKNWQVYFGVSFKPSHSELTLLKSARHILTATPIFWVDHGHVPWACIRHEGCVNAPIARFVSKKVLLPMLRDGVLKKINCGVWETMRLYYSFIGPLWVITWRHVTWHHATWPCPVTCRTLRRKAIVTPRHVVHCQVTPRRRFTWRHWTWSSDITVRSHSFKWHHVTCDCVTWHLDVTGPGHTASRHQLLVPRDVKLGRTCTCHDLTSRDVTRSPWAHGIYVRLHYNTILHQCVYHLARVVQCYQRHKCANITRHDTLFARAFPKKSNF